MKILKNSKAHLIGGVIICGIITLVVFQCTSMEIENDRSAFTPVYGSTSTSML